MFDPAAEYLLVVIAVLIPVGLLAGILHVLTHPLSLDEVERRHREAHPETTRGDGTARSVADDPSQRGRPAEAGRRSVLEIGADGTFTLNTQPVPRGGLAARLEEVYA